MVPLRGPGTQPLELETYCDPLLYVPPGLRAGQPAPLVVALHGAGGVAEGALSLLQPFADEHRLVLLAPASRQATWDGIRGGYGSDVGGIDRALDRVFRTVPVDPERVGIAGFSDGASYALGLGLANGELFHHLIAFSPGFIPPAHCAGPASGRVRRDLSGVRRSAHGAPGGRTDGCRVARLGSSLTRAASAARLPLRRVAASPGYHRSPSRQSQTRSPERSSGAATGKT